ncbi:MAG TPA: hypothetical protein VGI22_03945 [Xanthobacteraceae bacterium]|jgi:hypothetical protein
MTSKKALIALSSAIALGVLASGSAALAFNENDGGNETGGYVLPGSMDGVNPVYHPRWFPQYGRVLRSYDRFDRSIYSGAGSFAYAPLAHKHFSR